MDKIKCPNCGAVLYCDDAYDGFYADDYYIECCFYHCPQCEKDYRIDLHYKYIKYSIVEEI